MSDMKWGLTRPRWELLLCAFGIHKFDIYCASRHHGRDTMRTCYTCEHSDTRLTRFNKWGDDGPLPNSSDAARGSPTPKTEVFSSTPQPKTSAAASETSGLVESINKSGAQ